MNNLSKSMGINHKSDFVPALLVIGQIVFLFSIWLYVNSFVALALLSAVSILPRVGSAMIVHNSAHFKIFSNKVSNAIFDLFLYLETGMMTSKFRLHHNIGHHSNYLDPKKDPSTWVWRDGKVMPRMVYICRYFVTHTYFSIQIGLNYRKLLKQYIFQQLFFIAVLVSLFIIKPTSALIVFFIPMVVVWLSFINFTYDDHVGLFGSSEYQASFSKTGKLVNLLIFNNGYHLAHHLQPRLHWSELPAAHKRVKYEHPEKVPATTFLNKVFGDEEQ
jgi:beta-carotene hydroxylase